MYEHYSEYRLLCGLLGHIINSNRVGDVGCAPQLERPHLFEYSTTVYVYMFEYWNTNTDCSSCGNYTQC